MKSTIKNRLDEAQRVGNFVQERLRASRKNHKMLFYIALEQ